MKESLKIGAIAALSVLLLVGAAFAATKANDEEKKLKKEEDRGKSSPTKSVAIPAEISNEELIEERTLENGMKVAKIKQKVKVKKADIEKVLDDEAKKRLGKKLDELPEVLELEINVVKTGFSSITYGTELYKTLVCIDTVPVSVSDPVNLIFYNVGSAWDVQYDMKNWITYTWSDADGCNLMAYIDDTAHGGSAYWKKQDYQLEYGDYSTTRHHIRIFGGGTDTHTPGFGEWSLAGVHYEQWTGTGHEVLSWEDAESFVANDFAGEWFVAQVYKVYIGNAGSYQGVSNDGYARYIELTA